MKSWVKNCRALCKAVATDLPRKLSRLSSAMGLLRAIPHLFVTCE